MAERDVQAAIVDWLRAQGWRVWVFSDRRRALVHDWPDIFAARRGRLLFVECKSATGRQTPGQRRFQDELEPELPSGCAYVVARSVGDVEAALARTSWPMRAAEFRFAPEDADTEALLARMSDADRDVG